MVPFLFVSVAQLRSILVVTPQGSPAQTRPSPAPRPSAITANYRAGFPTNHADAQPGAHVHLPRRSPPKARLSPPHARPAAVPPALAHLHRPQCTSFWTPEREFLGSTRIRYGGPHRYTAETGRLPLFRQGFSRRIFLDFRPGFEDESDCTENTCFPSSAVEHAEPSQSPKTRIFKSQRVAPFWIRPVVRTRGPS
jgi:hypothetical protein